MYYNPYTQPYSYQPQMMSNTSMQQNQYAQPQQQMPSSSSITWVQGEVGARAYPVAAGSSVMLMDSDDKYFYIKSADNMGMPSLHKYYYSEVVEEQPRLENKHSNSFNSENMVNREELKELQDEIYELRQTIDMLQRQQSEPETTTTKGRKQQ